MNWSYAAIDHVQLAMPPGREEEAEHFYRDLLGFAVIAKPAELATRGGRWFQAGPVQIHLGVEEDFRPARKAHPGLVVTNFDGLLYELAAAGVEFRPADDIPGLRRGHIDDCFGNRLELIALDRCVGCGFEYHEEEAPGAGAAIVEGSDRLANALLAADRPALRPDSETWSALEYTCHLRDVLLTQRERLLLARWTDKPTFAPMARDLRVDLDGYVEQAPADVARQVKDAARMFANDLDRIHRLDPTAWDRMCIYNYPEPAERTLRWLAVHTLHEVRHHLVDVNLKRC